MQPVTNLIVGTGPSALAAALALRRKGIPFEVVDAGFDLEPDAAAAAASLAQQQPSDWAPEKVQALFPPAVASDKGVEKRFIFGSDFPYRRPEYLSIATEGCTVDISHGFGGFGNVWGGAILPYSRHDLADWGPDGDLDESYRNVARFLPYSAERDRLESAFPIHRDRPTALRRSEQTESLLGALNRRREALTADGIQFGRARVAVDSGEGPNACRYCGHCLEGCVYGSLFNPRLFWKELERSGVAIHRGFYALEFREDDAGVALTALDMRDGALRQWRAERLFAGLGALGTTRLLARSLGLSGVPIRIQDSQYFFFPLLAYKSVRDATPRFTLAEAFLEILNPRVSRNYVHFQIYGLNEIFRRTLGNMMPAPARRAGLARALERRFYLCQGFLHSADSGHLEMTLAEPQPRLDRVTIRAVARPSALRTARAAQSMLRKRLMGFGLIPPFYLVMTPPGRSFHAGGSFPMGANHAVFSSDRLARPGGLRRVHILDASCFPSIPASTITYTAMANADRVISRTFASGDRP